MAYNSQPECQPMQTPVIEVGMSEMEKACMVLDEVVAALETRLAIVLSEPPAVALDTSKNENIKKAQSKMTSFLSERTKEIDGVTARISGIIRRLDI